MPGPVYGLKFVHQAIKNGLIELDEESTKLSESFSVETAKDLSNKYEFLGKLLTIHAESEDAVLFPAIEEKEPEVTLPFSDDHKQEKLDFQSIQDKLQQTISQGSADSNLLADIKTEASQYAESIISHMDKEETQLWPIMDKFYTPPEQGPIMGKIGAFFKPEELAKVVPWIVNILDESNRQGYIQLMKKAFPEPVLEKAKGWIKDGVSDEVWQSVETSINA